MMMIKSSFAHRRILFKKTLSILEETILQNWTNDDFSKIMIQIKTLKLSLNRCKDDLWNEMLRYQLFLKTSWNEYKESLSIMLTMLTYLSLTQKEIKFHKYNKLQSYSSIKKVDIQWAGLEYHWMVCH